tara:strand:+ start:210 stop:869 length:660 start_codon:yes stop_codon:yes gene_type:complete
MIFEIKQSQDNTTFIKMYIMNFQEVYELSKADSLSLNSSGGITDYLEKIISGDFETDREEDIYNKYQELISQDMPNQAVDYTIRIIDEMEEEMDYYGVDLHGGKISKEGHIVIYTDSTGKRHNVDGSKQNPMQYLASLVNGYTDHYKSMRRKLERIEQSIIDDRGAIKIDLCFYHPSDKYGNVDETKRVYDFEEMANHFEQELSKLDKSVVVMCSIETI